MAQKTISIGGATYDLFVRTNQDAVTTCNKLEAFAIPLGEKIRVKEVIETCGGGASNSAVGLSRLGCDASFCGIIGSDQWGEALQKNFHNEGVNTTCTVIVEGEMTSFSIVLSASSGERVILYEPGTNTHLHDANFNREEVANADWVYLNHIQEHSCVIQDDIVDILAGDEDVRFTWNPGGCQIDMGFEAVNNQKLLEHTDMLQLNKEEAARFTKKESIEEALQAFVDAGVQTTCITDGSNGTIATDGKNIYHCPIIKNEEIVDTTGAGDSFGTGVTWALVEGFDLPTALRAGSINAASVVGHIGAQRGLLTDTQMRSRLESVQLDVAVSPLS